MTNLVQCPYCGERYPDAEPVLCCSELHCFPVSQATLAEEWRERVEGLRDRADDERFQREREEGAP